MRLLPHESITQLLWTSRPAHVHDLASPVLKPVERSTVLLRTRYGEPVLRGRIPSEFCVDFVSCELHLVISRSPGVGSSVPCMFLWLVSVRDSVQIRCPRLSSVLLPSSCASFSSGVMPRERVSAAGPHPEPGFCGRLPLYRGAPASASSLPRVLGHRARSLSFVSSSEALA